MFRRGIATAALTLPWWLTAGCGDRFGEPIVTAPVAQGDAGTSGTPAGPGPSPGASGAPDAEGGGGTGVGGADTAAGGGEGGRQPLEPVDPVGPLGLCAPCTHSDACGDANDACLRHEERLFCGRDCEEGRGCPEGYQCVELANSPLLQCVPVEACPTIPEPPTLTEVRSHFLSRINDVRTEQGRAPLEASNCLHELAQDSAVAYAFTDVPLGKFVEECDPVWPSCSCGWNAQAEAAVAMWGLDWVSALERALVAERFRAAVLATQVESVGIGFWISGDEAWIALSLH